MGLLQAMCTHPPPSPSCLQALPAQGAASTAQPQVVRPVQHPWLREHGLASDRPLDSVVLTRMAKFAAMNKLKKAALLVAARSLSEAEITGLSNLFKSIDTDGSGTITVEEMRQACSKMGSHFQVRPLWGQMPGLPAEPGPCRAVAVGAGCVQHGWPAEGSTCCG